MTSIFFGNEDDPSALYVQLEECKDVFEVEGFDKYMEMETEKNTDSTSGSFAIKLIRCPLCKTPIRRGRRYKNILNQNLRNLNQVKKMIENQKDLNSIETETDKGNFQNAHKYLFSLVPKSHYKLDCSNANAKQFFTYFVSKFYENAYEEIRKSGESNEIMEQFKIILKWILRHRGTIFTKNDGLQFQDELDRFFLYVDFAILWHHVDTKIPNVCEEDRCLIQQQKNKMYWPSSKVPVEEMIHSKKILNTMRKKYPLTGLGISDEERKLILEALGYSKKGHWYKCKNGKAYSYMKTFILYKNIINVSFF